MIWAVVLAMTVTLKPQSSAEEGSMTGWAAPLKEAPNDTHRERVRPTTSPVTTPCTEAGRRAKQRQHGQLLIQEGLFKRQVASFNMCLRAVRCFIHKINAVAVFINRTYCKT